MLFSIKIRSALIIGVCFLCFMAGMYLTFSDAVLRDAEKIESDQMREHVDRVVRALQENVDQLASKTEDWAKWDATYRFIEERNSDYAAGNLTFDVLSSLGLSGILYFNSEGRVVVGYEVDSQANEIRPLPEAIKLGFQSQSSLAKHLGASSFVSGLVTVGQRVYLVSSHPIVDSLRVKPVKGALVFLLEVSPGFVEKISAQTRLAISLKTSSEFTSEEQSLLLRVDPTQPFPIKRLSRELVVGHSIVKDISDKPALLVSVNRPRMVFQQSLQTRDLTLMYLVGWGLLATGITMILLHGFVLSPLGKLTAQVTRIAKTKDISVRLDHQGDDEIGVLAASVNSMLQSLQEAAEEVVRAKDSAEAANKAKTTFIAKVSHELRTPLNGIIGMLRIVLRTGVPTAVRDQLLSAREAADGLLAMINDILDYSKFQSGDVLIQKSDFSLVHLFRDVLSTVGPRAYEREGVEVTAFIHPSVPERLTGDALRLKQILVNLLGNAIKFTALGAIQVNVEKDSPEGESGPVFLKIRVIDTGCGIEASKIATIFDPFTQADDSPARRYSGTGLGLTIVKQLVEAMGGTVEAESVQGKGSEFRVRIPLEQALTEQSWSHEPSFELVEVAFLAEKGPVQSFFRLLCQEIGITPRAIVEGSFEEREFELGPKEQLLVDGAALEKTRFMKHLELMVKINGPEKICVVVAPTQVALKRTLAELGINRTIHKPVLSSDMIRLLRGIEPKVLTEEGEYDAAKYLGGAKLRVLVAEDVLLNQTIMRDLLEANNIAVKIVDDGRQLLDAVAPTLEARARDERSEEVFDLILTDIYMPNVDGIEATRLIRERESALGIGHLGRVPIVALTANAFREEHAKMIEAGIDEVVTKPLEPVELWRKFGAFLKMNRIAAPQEGGEAGSGEASPAQPAELSLSVKYPPGLSESGLRLLAYKAVSDVLVGNQRDLPALQRWYALLCSTRGRLIDEDQVKVEDLKGEFWRFDDFARRLGGSPRIVQKSLDMFTGSYPEMLHVIELAREAKNEDALKRGIHSLSGVLGQLGCSIGWYLAKEAESNCYFNDWYRMDLLLKDLRLITEVFAKAVQGFTVYNTPNLGSENSQGAHSSEKKADKTDSRP